jgi:hypothetical protein
MIWIGGLILAAALYVTGPDRFFEACLELFERIEDSFHIIVYQLGVRTFHVVRALAIAIYIVFLVLGLLAAQRGMRAWGAIIVVSAVFVVLVWRPYGMDALPSGRWLSALVIALVGAAIMTHRLLSSPPGPPRTGGTWRGGSGWRPPSPPGSV